jgi:hypothetical protein
MQPDRKEGAIVLGAGLATASRDLQWLLNPLTRLLYLKTRGL